MVWGIILVSSLYSDMFENERVERAKQVVRYEEGGIYGGKIKRNGGVVGFFHILFLGMNVRFFLLTLGVVGCSFASRENYVREMGLTRGGEKVMIYFGAIYMVEDCRTAERVVFGIKNRNLS
ncbi:hypothetical protein NPIL_608331 [Nephila pilipes]|uniref:Uncharacterized protein n=1 Tax=Nephila pilipes TaxID=299642 RepID=A0A8X6MWK6_NEPPI|nr:hypothetical protein NPIL_608331 [Nephila pilipes]